MSMVNITKIIKTYIVNFFNITSKVSHSINKVFLNISQNSKELTRHQSRRFLKKLQAGDLPLYKKDTMALVFSSEVCKILKNCFKEYHWLATSELFSSCFYKTFFCFIYTCSSQPRKKDECKIYSS